MKTESRIRLAAPQFVLWVPVFALAALCGSVTLSWAVYQAHLPGLLTQFGVSAEYGPSLGIIATGLAIALDPLMGRLADRTEWRRGRRFPLISRGVMLASAGFIIIPLVAGLMKNPGGNGRWVLPGLLLAWAIAMTLVRSPALALMRRYASPRQLPKATSVLTLAISMVGALSLAADELIKTLGAPITFTIAATALLLSTAWLRSHSLPITAPKISDTLNGNSSALIHPTPLLPLGFIFGLGLFMTLALRLMASGFSNLFAVQLPFNLPPVGWVLISLAIAAIPAGSLAMRLNNRKTMLLGLGLTAVSLVLSVSSVGLVGASQGLAIALSVALGISLSLVVNGILPLILSSVPSRNAGFATGTFFSGVAAATLGMMWFFERGYSNPLVWSGGAIAALVASGGCIVMSRVAVQSLKPTKGYQSS